MAAVIPRIREVPFDESRMRPSFGLIETVELGSLLVSVASTVPAGEARDTARFAGPRVCSTGETGTEIVSPIVYVSAPTTKL